MKKFSSRLVQSLLPLGIIVLFVSTTVKPMEMKAIEVDALKELEQLSLVCNFKDFQVKASAQNVSNEVNQLAEQGHIVALWTKLNSWYGKLNGMTPAQDVNQFLTDLVRFEVILGVNCVQYYNFTGDDIQAAAVYTSFKNHIKINFDTAIKETAASASSTHSYQGVLTQTENWLTRELSASEVGLPSCGWVADAKIQWHSQWSPSCKFYTVQTSHPKIKRHGSTDARKIAKRYLQDFSKAILDTLKMNQNWRPNFVNSTNDIEASLDLALLSVGKSVEALDVIDTLKQQCLERDQQIQSYEQQVSERDQQIKEYNLFLMSQHSTNLFEAQKNTKKLVSSSDPKKFKRHIVTTVREYDKNEILNAKREELELNQLLEQLKMQEEKQEEKQEQVPVVMTDPLLNPGVNGICPLSEDPKNEQK